MASIRACGLPSLRVYRHETMTHDALPIRALPNTVDACPAVHADARRMRPSAHADDTTPSAIEGDAAGHGQGERQKPAKAIAPRVRRSIPLAAFGNAPLHDTPAAVTVITRDQLDDRQPRTLSEIAHSDAAVGDNYAPVGYYQDISIRGFPLDLATGFRLNDMTITPNSSRRWKTSSR